MRSFRVAHMNVVAGMRHMADVAVADMGNVGDITVGDVQVCVPANLVETGQVEAGDAQRECD